MNFTGPVEGSSQGRTNRQGGRPYETAEGGVGRAGRIVGIARHPDFGRRLGLKSVIACLQLTAHHFGYQQAIRHVIGLVGSLSGRVTSIRLLS